MKENFLSPDSSDEDGECDVGLQAATDESPSLKIDQASFANFTDFSFPKIGTEDSVIQERSERRQASGEASSRASPTRSPSTPLGALHHVRDAVQDAAAAAALTPSLGSPAMTLGSRQARARHQASNGSQASDTGAAMRHSSIPEIKEINNWESVIDEEGLENDEMGEGRSRRQDTLKTTKSELEMVGGGEGFLSPPAHPHLRTLSGVLDTMSISASCAPSMAPSVAQSPHIMVAAPSWQESFPAGNSLTMSPCGSDAEMEDKNSLLVRILSPVDGKEELRFRCPLEADSEQQFLATLDRLCTQHVGQPLAGLNWLIRENEAFDRWQRRKCDVRMVEDLFDEWQLAAKDNTKGAVLYLCTIPAQPASELPRGKVRLKRLTPGRVSHPTAVQLETTALEVGPAYSLAFTSQWSNMTYSAEATVLPNKKGVEALVPWQMFSVSSNEGLYDVHLVIDRSYRSKNHQTLTVGSSESEVESSSAKSTSDFVPIERRTSKSLTRFEHHEFETG